MTERWETRSLCSTEAIPVSVFIPSEGTKVDLNRTRAFCRRCPTVVECLVAECRMNNIHDAEVAGCRGGAGGAAKRVLIRAYRDCDHHPTELCGDPDCPWCRELSAHLARLAGDPDVGPLDANGPGAVCGKPGTYVKGHRDPACTLAMAIHGAEGTMSRREQARGSAA